MLRGRLACFGALLLACQAFGQQCPITDANVVIVGGLGIQGNTTFYSKVNPMISYLNNVVGPVYNKTFQAVFLNSTTAYTYADCKYLDMIYTNPSMYMCFSVEYGAHAIISERVVRKVAGVTYPSLFFGGTFWVRANDTRIKSINDIAGKRLSAISIVGLGSGIAQWRELLKRNQSIFTIAGQLQFSGSQSKSVLDVYNGVADVAMVRSDQVEQMAAAANATFKLSDMRMLEPIKNPNVPFNVSTKDIYPEWPIAVINDSKVPVPMQQAIVRALLALNSSSAESVAWGLYDWVPPVRFIDIFLMHQQIGYLQKDGSERCIRSENVYDVINCPAGYFKATSAEFANRCDATGFPCPAGYQCACSPCKQVDSIPVMVYPQHTNDTLRRTYGNSTAVQLGNPRSYICSRLTQCAVLQRSYDRMTFTFQDNLLEARGELGLKNVSSVRFWFYGASIGATGGGSGWQQAQPDPTNRGVFVYEIAPHEIGSFLVRVDVDGVELDASPFIVTVIERICFNGFKPTTDGRCVCDGKYFVNPKGNCVRIFNPGVIIAIIVGGLLLILLILLLIRVALRRAADAVWQIRASELEVVQPVEVLGRGTFGLVIKGRYRGTDVAVKRCLPPSPGPTSDPGLASISDGIPSSIFPSLKMSSSVATSYAFAPPGSSRWSVVNTSTTSLAGAGGSNVRPEGMRWKVAGPRATDMVAMKTGPQEKQKSQVKASQLSIDGTPPAIQPPVANLKIRPHVGPGAPTGSYIGTTPSGPDSHPPSNSTGPDTAINTPTPPRSGGAGNGGAAAGTKSAGGTKSGGFGIFQGMADRARQKKLKASFIQEMRTTSALRHPNVTTLMGAVMNTKEPLLVMELMDRGSLYDLLTNETVVFEAETLLNLARDIACGMNFLHLASPPVVHCDLKAQNVLVDRNLRGKISDFGLSSKKFATGMRGTPFWMAPEVLRGEEPTTASDVYSFGITLFELLTRREPYEGEEALLVLEQVADDTLDPPKRPEVPAGVGVPPILRDLMAECYHKNPMRRPTMQEVHDRLVKLDSVILESCVRLKSGNGSRQLNADDIRSAESRLLEEVFPPHVAKQLREGRPVETERFDHTTIFFSDIVGFTTISDEFGNPEKVVDLLGRLYSKFDGLSRKHGVFKVETIGDAYVCVGGLPKAQPDHTLRIARFAIDAVAAASSTLVDTARPDKGYLQIRVGFHSGPVCGSVIGSRNPRYCLLGDTVNTSSRMETNSQAGRIHMSEEAAKCLKAQAGPGEFVIHPRGLIPIKGKGSMSTFWLEPARAPANSSAASEFVVPKDRKPVMAPLPRALPESIEAPENQEQE